MSAKQKGANSLAQATFEKNVFLVKVRFYQLRFEQVFSTSLNFWVEVQHLASVFYSILAMLVMGDASLEG